MNIRVQETLGLVATLGTLAGVPIAVDVYHSSVVDRDGRLIELTGVGGDGVWTDERVTAANAGLGGFKRATIIATVGEVVTLRLSSADVTHSFYVPELDLGPIEVMPGHYVEVTLPTAKAGEFMYYCTSVCGPCHHFMRGMIRVAEPGSELANKPIAPLPSTHPGGRDCPDEDPPDEKVGLADWGAHLFLTKGCINCHGDKGAGGIANPNYIKGTVPDLDGLVERMFIFEKEDCDTVIGFLQAGKDPKAVADDPPFPRYATFLAQYDTVRSVIKNGNPAAKKDESGPVPPLQMPMWDEQLNAHDIDALLVYLFGQYDWDD